MSSPTPRNQASRIRIGTKVDSAKRACGGRMPFPMVTLGADERINIIYFITAI